jgi:hypothetical protein
MILEKMILGRPAKIPREFQEPSFSAAARVLTVFADSMVEVFPQIAPPVRSVRALLPLHTAREALRRHDEHRTIGVGDAVPADRASPRVAPAAAAPSADYQQVFVAPGLVNETHAGYPDIHNHAQDDACRRTAESVVNAPGDEGLGVTVE